MHVNPGDTRDLNPVVKGHIYRATHKASVIGILGGDAPKVVSKGRRFYNRDRWTLRFLVDVMCEWAKKNPGCVPSHTDVTDWVRTVNAKVVSANEKEIVIANTPDVLPLRVAMALVGGAYHEALHTKYSCRRNLQPYEIIEIVVGRWARVKDWSVYVKALLEWSNIVEDIRIERRGREDYEGINVKMHDLQDFILYQEEKSQENLRDHGGKPGALSVIMGAFRDYGLGYNTDRQQNALARYVRDNPLAVELVLEGPLAPLLDEAINLKREDDTGSLRVAMDVIATLAELSERDKEDEQNSKDNQPGDGKTQCPNCGAPGNKLKVRPKSNGKGSRVKGKGIVTCTVCNWQAEIDVQTKKNEEPKPQTESEDKDENTPDFDGFDDLDPADKPKESKPKDDPKGKPSKPDPEEEDEDDAPSQGSTQDPEEDEGEGDGGDEEADADQGDEDTDKGGGSGDAGDDSDDSADDESESQEDVKKSKGGSGQAEDSADDEEPDSEGSGGAGEDKEGDEEADADGGSDDEDGEGAEGQDGDEEESDEDGSASGDGSDEDDEEGQGEGKGEGKGLEDGLDDTGLTDEIDGEEDEDGPGNRSPDASDDSEEIDNASGGGAGGHTDTNKPVENDWSDLANDAMEQAEAGDDLGLQDAGSALEEAINDHLDKEDDVQAGEAPWRPFDVSKDKVTVVPPSPKGIDKDKEDADLIIKSVKLETAYLRSRMRTMVRSIEMTGTARGVVKGRALSSRYLVDTVSTLRAGERPRRAFDHRGEAIDMTMACAVVLDQSGSMTGLRKDATRIMVAITEPLDALNCPTLAIGFRDGDDAKFGYRGYHNPAEDEGQYHRNHGVTYDIFKGFNEKFRTVRWRFANTRADGGTPMSDGVQFALNALSYRKEAHRFLFVVTDGYPNYGHPPVMNYQIRLAKEAGIFVIGVGIGRDAEYVKTTFPLSVWSEKVPEFPKLLLAKMNELIDMQATKRGRIVKDTSR